MFVCVPCWMFCWHFLDVARNLILRGDVTWCDHCLRKHLWWSRTLSSMKLLVPPWWKHSKRSPGAHSIPGQFRPCPTHSLLRTESCMKPTRSRWPLSWRGCVKIQQTSRSWSLKAVENCQRPKPDPSTPWVEGHHGPGCDSWHQFLFWEAAGHDSWSWQVSKNPRPSTAEEKTWSF